MSLARPLRRILDPVLGLVLATALPLFGSAAGQDEDSLRSIELLRWDCYSPLGRRELTLFGNGTLRLREGPPGQEAMWLHELRPEELDGYRARLLEESLAETPGNFASVEGDWVERCALELALPDREPRRIEFGRYDSLDLDLRRVVVVAQDMLAQIDREAPPVGAQLLPLDYDPAVGDRLRRVDGQHFEIIAYTADKLGVELQGIEQPLTLYLPRSEVRRQFVALESRRQRSP